MDIITVIGRLKAPETTISISPRFMPYGDIDGYDITIIGTGYQSTNDSLTGNNVASYLILDANQKGANVVVDVTDQNGFKNSVIYARKARSVSVYCREGGDCQGLQVECPEENDANLCRIYCDSDDTTSCTSMQMWTTNGYCRDVAVICSESGCHKLDNTQIYCGYNQTTDYCILKQRGGTFECDDYHDDNAMSNGFCSNNLTAAHCRNHTEELGFIPIALNDIGGRMCGDFPTYEPTESPTTDPSGAPSSAPTWSPSTAPTRSPTTAPTSSPTAFPSFHPSKAPSDMPTAGLAAEVHPITTTNISIPFGQSLSSEKGVVAALADASVLIIIVFGGIVCCLIGVFMERLYRKLKKLRKVNSKVEQHRKQEQEGKLQTGHVATGSFSNPIIEMNQFREDGNNGHVSGFSLLSLPSIISMSAADSAISAMSTSMSSPDSNDLLNLEPVAPPDDMLGSSTRGMELEINDQNASGHITGGREDEEVVDDDDASGNMEGATDQGVDGRFYHDDEQDEQPVVEEKRIEKVKGKGIRANSDSEIYREPEEHMIVRSASSSVTTDGSIP